jgi:hypothetical protein
MPQDDEERLELHDMLYGVLLERVRQDRYPSSTMLNILEEHMVGHERQALVTILVQKVAADRYPSIEMLKRIIRITS